MQLPAVGVGIRCAWGVLPCYSNRLSSLPSLPSESKPDLNHFQQPPIFAMVHVEESLQLPRDFEGWFDRLSFSWCIVHMADFTRVWRTWTRPTVAKWCTNCYFLCSQLRRGWRAKPSRRRQDQRGVSVGKGSFGGRQGIPTSEWRARFRVWQSLWCLANTPPHEGVWVEYDTLGHRRSNGEESHLC